MIGRHGSFAPEIRAVSPAAALSVGAAVGLLLGLVVVVGDLKLLLACLGVIFLAVGIVYPRLIAYVLVAIVVCLSAQQYGLETTEGVFRLKNYVVEPIRLNLYEILVYCLLAILVARRLLGVLPRGVPVWITAPCLVSALVCLLQLARALLAGTPYSDVVKPWNGQYVLMAAVALWCFTELFDSPRVRVRLLDLLYVCAAGRAVYALLRYVLAGGDTANAYRSVGVKVALFEYADHLVFAFLIVVAIAAWATGRVAGRRLAFWVGSSVVMTLTVALSYRRLSWFGLSVALILASVVLLRRHQRSVALLVTALVFVGGVAAASFSRFRSGAGLLARLLPDVVSTVGPTRQDEWALAWETIVRNPIAGDITARRVASQALFWDTRFVHNAFLFAWMKLGLAGLLSLCFLGGVCVVYAVRGVKMRGPEEHIALGATSVVPFVLALAMFEPLLIEIRTVLVLAVVGALAVRVAVEPSGREVQGS